MSSSSVDVGWGWVAGFVAFAGVGSGVPGFEVSHAATLLRFLPL
jgi:hypothetical protein